MCGCGANATQTNREGGLSAALHRRATPRSSRTVAPDPEARGLARSSSMRPPRSRRSSRFGDGGNKHPTLQRRRNFATRGPSRDGHPSTVTTAVRPDLYGANSCQDAPTGG